MSTTDGRLYLTALKSLEKVEIQYVPKELVLGRTANMAKIAIVGRNNPLHHYTGGETTLTLELDFHSEDENREDVIEKVRKIQSWMQNNGAKESAERVRLTFGKLFKAHEIWVIETAPARFSRFNPTKGCLPQQAYMTLTLSLDPDNNTTKKDTQWN